MACAPGLGPPGQSDGAGLRILDIVKVWTHVYQTHGSRNRRGRRGAAVCPSVRGCAGDRTTHATVPADTWDSHTAGQRWAGRRSTHVRTRPSLTRRPGISASLVPLGHLVSAASRGRAPGGEAFPRSPTSPPRKSASAVPAPSASPFNCLSSTTSGCSRLEQLPRKSIFCVPGAQARGWEAQPGSARGPRPSRAGLG